MKSTLSGKIARLALAAALAVPSVGVLGTTAFASGTSPANHGCYVQWWSTAWAGKCNRATATGNYRVRVATADQQDVVRPWHHVNKGATGTFDSGEAWRGVQNSPRNRVDFQL